MIADGNQPIIDYCLRSQEEQEMLFKQGVTKDDGITHVSAHQKALAADIYFVVPEFDGTVFIDFDCSYTEELQRKYHDLWVSWGGRPIIEWDKDHYQGYI